MVDLQTLAVLGGSATVVAKILGPTAEYLGEGLKNWAQARIENVQAIFSNAQLKLGESLEDPGEVSPRVLREILNEGSYYEDPVGVEYFGGILASSRSPEGLDDRGAAWGRLVSSLSSHSLRAHFVLYRELALAFDGESGIRPFQEYRIRIDHSLFIPAVGLDPADEEHVEGVAAHVFHALHQFDLLGQSSWGDRDQDGLVRSLTVTPSASGAELFLWALGIGDRMTFSGLFEVRDLIPDVDGIGSIEGVIRLTEDDSSLSP